MTVEKLIKILNATIVSVPENFKRNIKGGYCGDFLSLVMSKAPEDCVWFTVMTNINVSAVASLANVAVVVVCEGSKCDDALIAKAKVQNICIIQTDLPVFEAVCAYCGKSK